MKKINWRYTIGELLIVTAGITLAFGLNSMAEERKEDQKRITYLNGIKADLEDDAAMLDSTTAEIRNRLKTLYAMMPYFKGRTTGKDSALMKFFGVVDPVRFLPHKSTVQSLKYSGDLNLIKDIELKNRIVELYDRYDLVEEEYERHQTFSKMFLSAYFMEEFDYSDFSDITAFEDRYFRNLVFSLIGIYRINLERQEEALIRASEMKNIVSAKLNSWA